MKKILLFIGALVLVSSTAFAQKKVERKGDVAKAQTRTELTRLQAAPVMQAPGQDVLASSSVTKAPRRAMENELWYQRPEGSFYISGQSNNGDYLTYLYMPPFTTVTYKNMSANKEKSSWTLVGTEQTYPMDANEDYDLELTLDKIPNDYISTIYIPTLTVNKDSYRFGDDIASNGTLVNPTVALTNGDSLTMVTQVNLAPNFYIGFSDAAIFGSFERTLKDDNGEEIAVKTQAIYEFFNKPLRPLYVNDIYFRVVNYSGAPLMNEDTEMKATVCKIDDEGHIGDVIAEIPFTLADTLFCETYENQGKTYTQGAFQISQKETDAFGTEYDVPFVISDEFVIVISGFDQEGVDFSLFMTSDLKEDTPTDCYFKGGMVKPTCRTYMRKDTGELLDGLYYVQYITPEQSARYNEEDGDNTDWTRQYNAVIWLDCMEDVVSIFDDFKEMYADTEGGVVYAVVEEDGENVAYGTVQYQTTLPRLSTWSGYEGEENYQFEDLPDWLKVTEHIDTYYTEDDGYTTLTQLEADPLPEDVEGRKATIRIVSERGAEDTFTVIQGIDPGSILEITDGKYYLLNLEAEKYWGCGNEWSTRASLVENPEYVTLLKQPDGTYHMETQVSNGGTSYYFGGDYMDGNPVTLNFKQIGDLSGVAIFNISDADGKFYGYDGMSTVLGKDIQENEEGNTYWAVIPEQQMIELLNEASEDDPYNATFLILDPNLSRNNRNFSAWTGDGFTKGGSNTNNCVESYHKTFTMTQTLNNVPNGVYGLTAQGFYRQDGEDNIYLPEFFINDESATFPVKTGTENSMSDASASFSNGEYTIEPIYVEVDNGTITLGAQLEENAALWCIWDNFVLTYYGADASVKEIKLGVLTQKMMDLREQAKEMQELPYATEAANEVLNAALAATKSVNTAKEANVREAIQTLEDAIAEATQLNKTAKILYEGGLPDNSIEGWICTTGNNFEVNTWSVEGNAGNDPSGMVVPFIQTWVAAPGPLGAGELSYTLENVPADTYSVTALVRVYSESGNAPAGATYFVNNEKADIAAFGNKFDYNNMKGVYGNFGLSTKVGDDGILKFGVSIAEPTFNWVAIKDVKIVKGIPTGIQTIDTENAAQQNVIYNLNGQKVKKAQKGLYIINGNKVVVK